jgi:hypothetical protein
MRQNIYNTYIKFFTNTLILIITCLFTSCSSQKVVFKDDVYDNSITPITITSNVVDVEDDLYHDDYYMSVNSVYSSYRIRTRYTSLRSCGHTYLMGWNNFYDPHCTMTWNNYNFYNQLQPHQNYNYYYNPMFQAWPVTSFSSNSWSNQTINNSSIYSPRNSRTSYHRGNPNTIGTNTPTYTRTSYTKSSITNPVNSRVTPMNRYRTTVRPNPTRTPNYNTVPNRTTQPVRYNQPQPQRRVSPSTTPVNTPRRR